jgi:hypothetical protein
MRKAESLNGKPASRIALPVLSLALFCNFPLHLFCALPTTGSGRAPWYPIPAHAETQYRLTPRLDRSDALRDTLIDTLRLTPHLVLQTYLNTSCVTLCVTPGGARSAPPHHAPSLPVTACFLSPYSLLLTPRL